jgi:hypothetical protein
MLCSLQRQWSLPALQQISARKRGKPIAAHKPWASLERVTPRRRARILPDGDDAPHCLPRIPCHSKKGKTKTGGTGER